MKIFKADNPQIVELVYPTLDDFSTEQFDSLEKDHRTISEMALNLINFPEETCLIAAIDGEELIAYCYGYARPDCSWGWIDLAWAKTGCPKTISKEVFDTFCDWVISKGKKQIRAETELKNLEVWRRAYGFQQQAIIIKKDLSNG